jgi:cellulose synthase/poly-beta-1,6-N-acetylglucosamine synthase-like glycosyltransferase
MRFLVKPYNDNPLNTEKITVNSLTKTTFGAFRVGNETVAEVLARIRKTYHFESYFKGSELRVGSVIYIESEAKKHNFTFQENIISDELDYRRKDDITLSIVASNKVERETGETTKDGHAKTKCERLEVLVTLRNGSDTPDYFIKKKGEDYPPNTGGERMTMPYPFAKSIEELKTLALAELRKYYYTGFKGKFTTFGFPFVRMGDNVQIYDNILPERNGLYKAKSVDYVAGFSGIRQTIQLDYKLL